MLKSKVKADLLCYGLNPPSRTGVREGGAGPAGGKYFTFMDTCVNVPVVGWYVASTPLRLRIDERRLFVEHEGYSVELTEVPQPAFYGKSSSDGVVMWKLAQLHGTNCVASTVIQKCAYWALGKPCRFCAIEVSLRKDKTIALKTARQLVEVVLEAKDEGVAEHVTLTTGTTPTPDKGALYLAKVVEALKEEVDLPIHVQVEPPKDLLYLDLLYSKGADTIGIHVETLDEVVAKEVTPLKPSFDSFLKAWRHAHRLFGEHQVSSYIIIGLGERLDIVLRRLEEVVVQGVIPYVVPLRPLPGSLMECSKPPSPSLLLEVTKQACIYMKDYGLDPSKNRAGCVRCGACSVVKEVFNEV